MLTKTQCTIAFAIFYILGIVAYFSSSEIIFALLLLPCLIFAIHKRLITNTFGVVLFVVFLFAFFYSGVKIKNSDFLQSLAPANATIEGSVVSIPTGSFEDKTKFYLDVQKIATYDGDYEVDGLKTFVTVADNRSNYSKIQIGDEVKLKGKLREPVHATNPSQFSYANYLRNFNTFTTFYVESSDWQIVSPPRQGWWKFVQSLNNLRQEIIATHARVIKSPNIEVLGGIVFGDDAISPPPDIKDSFRNSGLLHILAASGLNVGIIFGIWFFFSQLFKIPYRIGIVTGMGLIIFYTFMTGFGPPVLRASLMLLFALVGKLIDRDADNVALLFFVAFLLLLYNPAMLFDVGFELSFVVTLGLLIGCPVLANLTKKYPQWLAGALYLPILAQLLVAPIQIYYFNTFSTYSVFANIASLPFVTVISAVGFGSSILAMIPKLPYFVMWVCDWFLNPFITALVAISQWFSSLPHALLTMPEPTFFQTFLYYSILGSIIVIIKKGISRNNLAFLLFFSFLLGVSFIQIPNKNSEIIFFDVGNADCILIKSPNQKYFVVDTGKKPFNSSISQSKTILYEYLRDRGVRHVEKLIITHFDSDHAGGTVDLLNLVEVKEVVLTKNAGETSLARSIGDYLSQNKIKNSLAMNNNVIYKYGDFSIKTFVLPPKSKHSDNENSIVTLVSDGDSNVLLAADASANTVLSFANSLPEAIEVFKVGHHGAEGTISSELVRKLGIKFAIISTGYNQYGHPSFSTVRILENNDVKTARSDADNAIKVEITPKNTNILGYDFKAKKWRKKLF